MRWWRYILLGLAVVGSAAAERPEPIALASLGRVLTLPGRPAGVVVAADGEVYVSDAALGTVHVVELSGRAYQLADGLDGPYGLALDSGGRLLIVERGRGRILRRGAGGGLTVLAEGLREPEWIVAAGDGSVFVTVDRREIVKLGAEGLEVFAAGLDHAGGLALTPVSLSVTTKTGALQYSLSTAGSAPELAWGGLKHGAGAAVDLFGAIYVAAREVDAAGVKAKDAVAKLHPSGAVTLVARGLREPLGTALGPDGSLYVTDAADGAVLRLRAPAPPVLAASPAFTHLDVVRINGAADASARVDVATSRGVFSTGTGASGTFGLSVPLELDVDNVFQVFATAALGAGLTGAPAEVRVKQDSRPPTVRFARPGPTGYLRSVATIEVDATDDGSGIEHVALSRDGTPLAASRGRLVAPWDTIAAGDGSHTLAAVAVDRAGNRAMATRVVRVDNTPPETVLTQVPPEAVRSRAAGFRFSGADNLTPSDRLLFSWRLDGSPWSVPSPVPALTLEELAPGEHLFEVAALDLAGNEDPTPAAARFVIRSGPALTISTPAAGTVVGEGLLLVRGSLDAGGEEAGVIVNEVPATVDGGTFAALVPVFVDTVALTAVATTAGGIATHTVEITVTPGTGAPAVVATPAAGLAPLSVTFAVSGGVGVSRLELDADGDGRPDVTAAGGESASFTYAVPGVYFPVVRITDITGAVVSATTLVQVADAATFEDGRRLTWSILRDALARGDVAAAAGAFAATSRGRYAAALTALAPELPRIAREMEDLALVTTDEGLAELATTRVQDGRTRLYLVYFVLDDDGRWRILMM